MQGFTCRCDAQIFFENSVCVNCGSELGWCPHCNTMRAIVADSQGQYFCTEPSCAKPLSKCHNYAIEKVCNRCIPADQTDAIVSQLCDYCRFNDTIPDLSIDGNWEKWRQIEIAKRRLLYTLDRLKVPYGSAADNFHLPLSFDFKADSERKRLLWFNVGKQEQVYTGHANGKVTLNIREADNVEREKARVSFGEAHRTLIGHFRHEIGHYFWDVLVKDKCEPECIAVFGDHYNPDYSAALKKYYEEGQVPGWEHHFISAYATMHPWEDFAECFAAYLDMISVLDIAHTGLSNTVDPTTADFEAITEQYMQLGLLLNEMNRAVGLLDLVPEVFTPAILNKISFIHNLIRAARQ